MQVVAFGDMPAALALELANELGQAVDPMAADQLLRNSYVDDVGGGGNDSDEGGSAGGWLILGDCSCDPQSGGV